MAMIDTKKHTKHISRMLYSNQNGVILIWLILMMVVASIFGLSMVYLTTSSTQGKLFANSRMRAYYVAEAGGRYAIPLVSADIECPDIACQCNPTSNMDLLDNQEYTLDNNDKFLLEIDPKHIGSYFCIHPTCLEASNNHQ